VDLVGSLPRSTRGYSWLLMAQDRFSKWIEAVLLGRATTDKLAAALIERVIYRHGCPRSSWIMEHNSPLEDSSRFWTPTVSNTVRRPSTHPIATLWKEPTGRSR